MFSERMNAGGLMMRTGRQDNRMEWAEAERQVKAIMEKHGYRTMEGVPAKIDWEGREHLLDLRCVQCAGLRDALKGGK